MDSRKTVRPLTTKCLTGNRMNTEVIEVKQKEKRREEAEEKYRQKSHRRSTVVHSVSLIVLHVLDAMLLIILLPFIIWQWVSANDRLKLILRAVVGVTLELIMWVIFAGVSILMTTTFVLEDIYFHKRGHEKSMQPMNAQEEITSSNNETSSYLTRQDKQEVPENED